MVRTSKTNAKVTFPLIRADLSLQTFLQFSSALSYLLQPNLQITLVFLKFSVGKFWRELINRNNLYCNIPFLCTNSTLHIFSLNCIQKRENELTIFILHYKTYYTIAKLKRTLRMI